LAGAERVESWVGALARRRFCGRPQASQAGVRQVQVAADLNHDRGLSRLRGLHVNSRLPRLLQLLALVTADTHRARPPNVSSPILALPATWITVLPGEAFASCRIVIFSLRSAVVWSALTVMGAGALTSGTIGRCASSPGAWSWSLAAAWE